MKLSYPALLISDPTRPSEYAVEVPDLPGCATGGNSLAEALLMAQDAVGGWVLSELEEGGTIPKASKPEDIHPYGPHQSVIIVPVDMDAYATKYGRKSTRKNVTIPSWLDTWANEQGLNYSKILSKALEDEYEESSRRQLQAA